MIVSINSLAFGFTPDKPIFNGFDWEVADGERWAVLGPSGCGKSTLLLLMAGIIKPNAGDIFIGGNKLVRPRPQTGLILQEYGLLPWATVQQNYELGQKLRSFYGPDGKHAPQNSEHQDNNNSQFDWLKKLGLDEIRERFPSQISGGQQQRTAIARTLLLNPDLLLMDEPFGSLDAPTSVSLQNLILKLNKEDGIAMVLITHSVETAAFIGEKILLLDNPPNSVPQIINNPNSGNRDFRDKKEYQELCQTLRTRMEGSL
jgi:ABC-type nitrate/sulfonate/bicarbonate transport system ATPase subunit